MRILVLTEHYLPRIAGTVTHVEFLTRALSSQGHDVFIVAPGANSGEGNNVIKDSYGRIIIYNSQNIFEDEESNIRNKFIKHCKKNINKFCEEYKPDIIHVMFGHYLNSAIKNVRLPKIWTCHNVPPNEYIMPFKDTNLLKTYFNRLYRRTVRLKHSYLIRHYNYDRIISVSDATQKILIQDIGIPRNKIRVIPNGISNNLESADFKYFTLGEAIRLITVGGIKPHKNIHLIPKIGSMLISAGIDFQWYVVGAPLSKEYANELIAKIDDLKLKQKVFLCGEISQDELNNYLKNSHLYIHLASEEGFCLTVLEALSLGVPVVGTRVGAIPEMIALGSGVVVEPRCDDIFAGILEAIDKYNSFKSGSALAEIMQSHYGWEQIAIQTSDLYSEVLLGNK